MPIKKSHRLPNVGDTFTRNFKGVKYTMTIVKAGKSTGYKVKDSVYNSPSAAAKSITKNDVNGWVFWRIEK